MNFDIAIQLIGSVFMNLILTIIILQKVHLNFTDNVAKLEGKEWACKDNPGTAVGV